MFTTMLANVMVRPYAGKLMIIKDLPVPEPQNDAPSKHRPSYFDRPHVLQTLIRYLAEVGYQPNMGCDEVVNGILSALETFMKHKLRTILEICVHRTNFRLLRDPRCSFDNDMRATMMFIQDMDAADLDLSDDSSEFYLTGRKSRRHRRKHRHRIKRLQQNQRKDEQERLESINYTALLALGGRKRPAELDHQAPQRPPPLRFKHIKIKDIIHFMECDKRYKNSVMLYEAYLKYKT